MAIQHYYIFSIFESGLGTQAEIHTPIFTRDLPKRVSQVRAPLEARRQPVGARTDRHQGVMFFSDKT